MTIPKDKVMHALAGLLAGVVGVVLGAAVCAVAGEPVHAGAAVGALVAATAAGCTKEVADHQENKVRPGAHGVELLDAVATAAPGWVLFLLILWGAQ